jgi:hypothetical protein
MNEQSIHDDDDLIYFFKNFESIMSRGVPTIDQVSTGVDFSVFREFLINDIRELQKNIDNTADDYRLWAAEHLFNIIDWERLIDGNRGDIFSSSLEQAFEKEFGDKKILTTLYDKYLQDWLTDKDGRHKVGGNTYTIFNSTIYYRNRFQQWYQVEDRSAFDLQPKKTLISEQSIITHLSENYSQTIIDKVIQKWNEQNFQSTLPEDFLEFNQQITSPEEYFDFSIEHIKALVNNPISLTELERWNGGVITNLEDIITLCIRVLEIVKERRRDKAHTLYLLRDSLLFYETHKVLDILDSEETSSDQLLIGRKLLSQEPDKWGYYIAILEALYEAHKRYPNNYNQFYNEFTRLMDIFSTVNPKFKEMIEMITPYIRNHMQTNQNNVVIFDVGFQGSINLLVQYMIDRHISMDRDLTTDIKVSVGALWSKELFGNRIMSDYFPFLNRVQQMATSDELYHYVFSSLNKGRVSVSMGDKNWQHKAAIERAVMVMLAKLDKPKAS